ncbi:C40 family peptidase, partial [Photobacterium sanguinicancri]|uniref:C40 family peptidase n=1 Tax=Photobacterium sanguinicancri TaxID=875932 RepID=UPI0019622479
MLRDKIISQIREHAADDYPNEACGLIVAVRKSQRYIRCRNVHPEPAEHFQIDPSDYADAEDIGRVLAVVHSHPDATSRPSRMDSAQCDAGGLP